MRDDAATVRYVPSRSTAQQVTRAQAVKLHDDGSAQILRVFGQEGAHAGILRCLRAQGDEPHLGVDVGMAEAVNLPQFSGSVHPRQRLAAALSFEAVFHQAFRLFRLTHHAAGEGAAIPAPAAPCAPGRFVLVGFFGLQPFPNILDRQVRERVVGGEDRLHGSGRRCGGPSCGCRSGRINGGGHRGLLEAVRTRTRIRSHRRAARPGRLGTRPIPQM